MLFRSAIDCEHRVADLSCAIYPLETTRFHPLFLYESISGVIGALVLIWAGYHLRKRLRPGDLLLVFFVWYGIVRFSLEPLRHANWTFDGFAVAQLVSLAFIVPSLLILLWRHRPGHPDDDPATFPADATWGALGRPVELEPDAPEPDAPEPDAAEAGAVVPEAAAPESPSPDVAG